MWRKPVDSGEIYYSIEKDIKAYCIAKNNYKPNYFQSPKQNNKPVNIKATPTGTVALVN
jgi:hypothetical protein